VSVKSSILWDVTPCYYIDIVTLSGRHVPKQAILGNNPVCWRQCCVDKNKNKYVLYIFRPDDGRDMVLRIIDEPVLDCTETSQTIVLFMKELCM
jgi:hypothetical protein